MPIKYGYKQIKRIGLIAYSDAAERRLDQARLQLVPGCSNVAVGQSSRSRKRGCLSKVIADGSLL